MSLNDAHHAEMAENFINVIAQGLKAYGDSRGYRYDIDYYQKLSWGGIYVYKDGTISEIFESNVPDILERVQIEALIQNEQYANDNSKGKKPCE